MTDGGRSDRRETWNLQDEKNLKVGEKMKIVRA